MQGEPHHQLMMLCSLHFIALTACTKLHKTQLLCEVTLNTDACAARAACEDANQDRQDLVFVTFASFFDSITHIQAIASGSSTQSSIKQQTGPCTHAHNTRS